MTLIDVSKQHANNTDINNTEFIDTDINDTDLSILSIIYSSKDIEPDESESDWMDRMDGFI